VKGIRGVVVVVGLLIGAALLLRVSMAPGIEEGSVLTIELQGSYVDGVPNPLGPFFGRAEASLLGVTSEIRKAERDPRIATVIFRVRGLDVGWGQAAELRDAVARIGARGKETVSVLEFEGFGNAEYYVASAAGRVVADPASRNPFVGLAGEYLFFGGLMEKLGVVVEYERIGRYKSAAESYAESKMSDASREMSEALLGSIYDQFVGRIAASRGLEPEQVRAAIDQGPTTPDQMRELGLLDEVAGFREVIEGYEERLRIGSADYAAVGLADVGIDPVATFAIVYGTGPVVVGEGDVGSGGSRVMASETVSNAIRDAALDPEVSAIILRLNSPGGSPLASDLIWRAVRSAQDGGKPVIVSMSDAAASGGYYVACAADKIVSQPETLTGSIGVFILRPALGGLLEKVGIGVEPITRGARADLLLSSDALTPGTRDVLRKDIASVYELFLTRVSEGRGLSRDAVDGVGQGRVWTGAQALEIGLVDALGGIPEAVALAKEEVGIAPEDDAVLVTYPTPKPLAEQIAALFNQATIEAAWPAPVPEGLRRLFGTLAPFAQGGVVLLPPGWIVVH
jgi:protease-4